MKIDLRSIPILWYGGLKPGRQERMEAFLQRLGLSHARQSPTYKDASGCTRIGCGKSHAYALTVAEVYDSPVLLLEDDVSETEQFQYEFEIPDDADAVYLGTCLNGLHPDYKKRDPDHACCGNPQNLGQTNDYYQIAGMLTTHAILYVTEAYRQICKERIIADGGRNHCDVVMASHMQEHKVYAVKEPWLFQDCEHENKDAFIQTRKPLRNLFR